MAGRVHAMAFAAGENARLFMQAIAIMIADGTNKGETTARIFSG
jgi:hypothetical protein